jgi:GT2 family glycosyltransferase
LRAALQFAFWHAAARLAAWLRPRATVHLREPDDHAAPAGISVVIPSRNGRSLLAAQLPGIVRELAMPAEIIVVDNGSTDGTRAWLESEWPQVRVEESAGPLSFAAAVNRGIALARYSHICLLNNDMLLEPGFFSALRKAFDEVPRLFCATAQIRFPAGVRREETGKAVMAQAHPDDFPIRCDEPIAGEDLTWVLYGSGGCSLYDARLLRTLGGMDEAYAPAYVEDLDVGYRAWQWSWPTVFVAGAVVEHRHRATTSRYYTEAQLAEVLEVNYLKFLARAVADTRLFRRLWSEAISRLHRRHGRAIRHAARIALAGGARERGSYPEERILALTGGDVASFPGNPAAAGALVTFADRLEMPAANVLARYRKVVLVSQGNELALRTAREWETNQEAGGKPLREFRLPRRT